MNPLHLEQHFKTTTNTNCESNLSKRDEQQDQQCVENVQHNLPTVFQLCVEMTLSGEVLLGHFLKGLCCYHVDDNVWISVHSPVYDAVTLSNMTVEGSIPGAFVCFQPQAEETQG